jgi:peptide/nickel transport system substrate-binding protein
VTPPVSRRNLLKGTVAGTAALTLPGWLAACSTAPASSDAASAGAAGAPVQGGTLIVGLYLEPSAIDPNREYYWETFRVSRNIYENLVQEDLSTNAGVPKLVPGLATAWTPSDGYRTWTLNLRKGVKFHDGTDFSAQSLDQNVRRFNDPTYRYFDKVSQTLLEARFGDLEKASVVDDFTYSFEFNHPYIGLPRLLAQSISTILPFSPAALAKYGNDGLALHPTGTGPYKFVSRQIGDQIVLQRNPGYWGKQPYLDKLVFRIIADDPTRLAALESGEVHLISRVEPQDVNSLTAKGFAVPAGYGAQVDYIQFNWTNKYIQNAYVRQAIAQALNRGGDATDIYDGYAKALRTFLPVGNVAYNPDADYGYTFDLAGAEASLARSGFKPGEVTFNIVTWNEDTPEASYLAENFKAAGINASVVGVTSADLAARQQSALPADGIYLGEYGGTYPEWISEGYAETVTSTGGTPYVNDKVISAAIAKARYNSDPATYVKLWQQADAAVVNNAAVVPTVNFTRYYGVSPRVKGFVWPNTNWYSLWDVWLEA